MNKLHGGVILSIRRQKSEWKMFGRNELGDNAFIIAEVGQNHQGDLELARKYIEVFANVGADAVKFQTRNNRTLFSEDAFEAVYNSENAFAETYGEHREKLELKPEWIRKLKEDCIKNNVRFMSTPFDEPSLELLMEEGVEILKIASFDIGNLPFIERIGKTGKPIVLSVGGGNDEQIRSSADLLLEKGVEVALLHCVSEYPCEYSQLGLDRIPYLINQFPACTVGLSDHFNGILSGPVAYMKGARVFEKHVTLNRAWKGTDHGFALEPGGFRRFARDIRRVRHMMKPKGETELGNEPVFRKLGKSLVAGIDIEAGDRLGLEALSGRIFNTQHIPVREANQVIGRVANRTIREGMPITYADLAPEK